MKKLPLIIVALVIVASLLVWNPFYPEGDRQAWASLNDEGATEGSVKKLADGSNQFGLELLSRLSENGEKNIFFSPWSIYTALGMTYEGAEGQTAEEMETTLHLVENDNLRRPSIARIQNLLNENKKYTLETANALWAQKDYTFLDTYLTTIEDYYGGKVTNLDFVNEPQESCDTINDWVSEKTREKIEKLIKKSMITPATRLVLTNAIYFKGDWVKQFDKDKTRVGDFWVGSGETVQVPMMKLSGENAKFNYVETGDLKALELPYNGGEVSMLILLPKDRFGLNELKKSIDSEKLEYVDNQLNEEKVSIKMPKFKLETEYSLNKDLKDMGMPAAFLPNADFSKMTGNRDLYIKQVVHKAFVEVNEEGTEAAAATGIVMPTSVGPQEKTFHADHPFMFLIQHKQTGTILFMGEVNNPAE